MLTDSKVRQAGFIRNNSSRKGLYQQELEKKDSLDGSDDSFSSFQYQKSNNVNYTHKQQNMQLGQYEQTRQTQKRQIKPPVQHIPPKPQRKSQIRKSSLTNQKSKTNFFEQPQQHPPNYRIKQQVVAGKIDLPRQPFPRVATPQFQQIRNKPSLSQIQNIRNRIGSNSKVLQGNFSFNPKTNSLKKEIGAIKQRQGQMGLIKNVMKRVREVGMINKPKLQQQNYYFNNQKQKQNRFMYDFSSLSEEEQSEHSQSEINQSFGTLSKHPQTNNQKLQFQQKQMRNLHQKVQQQQGAASKTLSKNNFPQGYSKQQNYIGKNNASNNNNKLQSLQQNYQYKRMQDDESEDEGQFQEMTGYNQKTGPQIRGGIMHDEDDDEDDDDQSGPVDNYLQGLIEKQGGICFEVDVKHFSYHSQAIGERRITNASHQGITTTVVNTHVGSNPNTHANNYKTKSNNNNSNNYETSKAHISSHNNAHISLNNYNDNNDDENSSSNDDNINIVVNRDPDLDSELLQPMNRTYTKANNYSSNNYNNSGEYNNAPIKKPVTVTSYNVKKKKKANDKQQLLRRREMAKAYSQQARFRLFGFA